MAKIAQASSGNIADSQISSNSTYYAVMANTGLSIEATEAYTQITQRTAGVASGLFVRVSANNINGTTTVRTRKDGGNGAQSVAITDSSTGSFEDTSNTDTITAGEKWNYSIVSAGNSGAMTIRDIITNFSATTNTVTRYASVNQTTQLQATTILWALSGVIGNLNTTETRARAQINTSNVTFRNMFAYISANSLTGNCTIRLRDDGGTSLSLVVSAGTTGVVENTADSSTPATDSAMNFYSNAASGGTSITYEIISVESSTTDSTYYAISDNSNGSATSTSVLYFNFNGLGSSQGTESVYDRPMRIACNISNAWINISANTANGTSQFALRVNGSDSACSVAIGATLTGNFEDTTNTVSVTAGQTVKFKMTRGGTGTITSRTFDAMVTSTESDIVTSYLHIPRLLMMGVG